MSEYRNNILRGLLPAILLCLSLCLSGNENDMATGKSDMSWKDYQRMGEKARNDAMYKVAITNFQAALGMMHGRQGEEHAVLCCQLAETYLLDNQVENAKKALLEHYKGCPGGHPAEITNRMVYLYGRILFEEGNYVESQQALVPLQAAEAQAPYHQEALDLLIDLLGHEQEWQTLSAMLEAELKQDSLALADRENIAITLGQAWLAQEQYDKILDVLQLYPESQDDLRNFRLRILRILSLAGTGQTDQAMAIYRTLGSRYQVKDDYDWWGLTWLLGNQLLKANRAAEAEQVLNDAVGVAVNDFDKVNCLILLAELRIKLGMPEEAMSALTAASQLHPPQPHFSEIQMRLGEVLRDEQKFEKAIDIFLTLANDSSSQESLRPLGCLQAGNCQMELGEYGEASKSFYQASELFIGNPEKQGDALLKAGTAACRGGDNGAALKYYSELADNLPDTEFAPLGRLEAGRVMLMEGEYADAIEELKRYVEDYPQHGKNWEAKIELGRGMCLLSEEKKDEKLFLVGLDYFNEVCISCPDNDLAVQAGLEYCEHACKHGYINRALEFYGELAKKFASHERYPEIQFRRINLLFQSCRWDEAMKATDDFLVLYDKLEYAAYLRMMQGDWYAMEESWASAQSCYAMVSREIFSGWITYQAEYELAYSTYRKGEYPNAQIMLTTFLGELKALQTNEDGPKIVSLEELTTMMARAEMLLGDVMCAQKIYSEALRHYTEANKLANDTELGIAALGRMGDMWFQLAVGQDDSEMLENAIKCQKAINDNPAAAAMHEQARYRLGRYYEAKKELNTAIEWYQQVYLNYAVKRDSGELVDPEYYYQSACRLTELLEQKGDLESLRQAVKVYEDLAQSDFPGSNEMEERVKKLRKKYSL